MIKSNSTDRGASHQEYLLFQNLPKAQQGKGCVAEVEGVASFGLATGFNSAVVVAGNCGELSGKNVYLVGVYSPCQ